MKQCPNCRHPVEEGATACPNCPASWETEEEAAYRRRHAPRFLSVPGPVGLLVLAAAALLAGWKALDFVLTWGNSESRSSPIVQFVEKRASVPLPANPRVLDADAAPASVPPAEAADQADQADDDEAVMISHREAQAVKRWRFRGTVYDLVTLAPVGRCSMEFADDATGARYQTATDRQGRYRVELPPLEGHGYSVRISAGGYAPTYLDPGIEKAASKSVAERKTLASELGHSLDGPYTVESESERPVMTDFFLAPAE